MPLLWSKRDVSFPPLSKLSADHGGQHRKTDSAQATDRMVCLVWFKRSRLEISSVGLSILPNIEAVLDYARRVRLGGE